MPATTVDKQSYSNGATSSATTNRQSSGLVVQWADWLVPPSSRQRVFDGLWAFASARPILFSFLAAQALLSFFPLLLFASFSVGCVLFALGAAVVFALLWIGLALLVLVPTLLLTFSVAVLVWSWGLGSFVVARWLYDHLPLAVNGAASQTAPYKGANKGSVKD